MAYESIYPRTPVGTFEIKTLPARTTLVASAPGDAFNDRGAAFMKLFNYIKANQIAMSVPVAASASTNEMVFFVGARALRASAPLRENEFSPLPVPRPPSSVLSPQSSPQLMNSRTNELMHFSTLPASGGVSVQTVPETVVASLGLRGSYSRAAFDAGAARLAAWLAGHPQWRADGPPYAVYWNSPFVPWFLRKSEIHQPLKPVASALPAFYTFEVETLAGARTTLASYRGKVALVVNVASKCGFTKQYAGLQKLYETYRERGLVVLGFPSNDFLGQEPGTSAEIQQFCTLNFGVTFPLFSKIRVKGDGKHPLYAWLTDNASHPGLGGEVSWNFNKFLVGRDGALVARFGSRTTPDAPELIDALEKALKP